MDILTEYEMGLKQIQLVMGTSFLTTRICPEMFFHYSNTPVLLKYNCRSAFWGRLKAGPSGPASWTHKPTELLYDKII